MHDVLPPSAVETVDSLLTVAPLVIYQVDLNSHTVLYVSPNLAGILGYTAAEVIDRPRGWIGALHPEDRRRVLAGIRSSVAAGSPIRQDECRLRHKDGEYRWFRAVTSLRFDAATGRTTAAGLLLDVTEQKEAEGALRRSEEYHRSLLENGSDMIHVLNADWTIRYVSPSIERILGYPPEYRIGRGPFDLMHPDDVPAGFEYFSERVRSPGAVHTAEFRFRHSDGTYRVLEVTAKDVLDDPTVAGIVVNSRDVTERRRAEDALRRSAEQLRQAQKMEAVGRLAGGVAHDFNNLLTIVSGYGQLLLQRIGDEPLARRYIEGIIGAARQAAALTDQLLTFSRRRMLQPKVLDLNAIVTETESLLRRLIGADIELTATLDPDLGRIRADPSQIEQVILNLVVNARDAMPEGGKILIETCNADISEEFASWQPDTAPGPYVVLHVTDTGRGMDDQTISHIFEPFYTTKGEGKGTGLGLSTVYGIVKQSGGAIHVYSEPERGTTFKVFLPRINAEAEVARSGEGPTESWRGSETVLVVEDQEDVRVLIREVLELNGYTVLEAGSGEEAIRLLDEGSRPIQLLVTDVVMPQVGGRALAQRLTEVEPDARVLFVSGYSRDEIASNGFGLAADFLQKPFTPTTLAKRVREILDAPRRGGAAQGETPSATPPRSSGDR